MSQGKKQSVEKPGNMRYLQDQFGGLSLCFQNNHANTTGKFTQNHAVNVGNAVAIVQMLFGNIGMDHPMMVSISNRNL